MGGPPVSPVGCLQSDNYSERGVGGPLINIETYWGYTIEEQLLIPGGPSFLRSGRLFLVVEQEREIFRLSQIVGRIAIQTQKPVGQPFGGGDESAYLAEKAEWLGRRRVHGMINLGRFEEAGEYRHQWVTEADAAAQEPVNDEELLGALLTSLRRLHRKQQNTSEILTLDVAGIALVLNVSESFLREVLGEAILEGLVEGYAETLESSAVDGSCRITPSGLERLRQLQDAADSGPRFGSATRSLSTLPTRPPDAALASTLVRKPLRVFLCHASQDKPAVRLLYQRLRTEGYKPWLDEEDLLPGQDWEQAIAQAVSEADVVLVCLSQASIGKRGYVQKEIKRALDVADMQPEGRIFLIPVKLEECTVPDRLRPWHWVNYFEERGHERLALALQERGAALEEEAWADFFDASNDISALWSGPGAVEEIRSQRER